ncbi:ankyrin repeat domain-containing protein [Chryseobacterium sp.]|uniref:ankyrin repeat domain-containing protein n=1 Tax=Chryseobacterium sp. TaxID=1871047 RepID=UPI00289F4166|nr:ankyrin repeat domain-containing protein [Chryseobacterium sp.]
MKNIISTIFAFALIFVTTFAKAQQITSEQQKRFQTGNVEEFKKAFPKASINKCIDVKDESFTPLAYATRHSKTEIFNYLIKSGADVNVACKGNTALMEGAKFDVPAFVKILLQKGADKNAKDNTGATAKDYAVQYKRTQILELLK